MKKKIMVILCSLLLAMPVFSFAKEKMEPNLSVSANEQTIGNAKDKGEGQVKKKVSASNVSARERANENAKFKRTGKVFNNKANKKIRAKKLVKKRAAEAVEEKKKEEKAEDKGEGQVKVKF